MKYFLYYEKDSFEPSNLYEMLSWHPSQKKVSGSRETDHLAPGKIKSSLFFVIIVRERRWEYV